MKIDDLICELLKQTIVQDDSIVFDEKTVELIHEIAHKCNQLPIVQYTQQVAENYAEGLTAEQVYIDMLNKIVSAPTRIHMRMSARMLIPIIDRKLKEGNA
jgi:predicted P-loop ATPase